MISLTNMTNDPVLDPIRQQIAIVMELKKISENMLKLHRRTWDHYYDSNPSKSSEVPSGVTLIIESGQNAKEAFDALGVIIENTIKEKIKIIIKEYINNIDKKNLSESPILWSYIAANSIKDFNDFMSLNFGFKQNIFVNSLKDYLDNIADTRYFREFCNINEMSTYNLMKIGFTYSGFIIETTLKECGIANLKKSNKHFYFDGSHLREIMSNHDFMNNHDNTQLLHEVDDNSDNQVDGEIEESGMEP